MRFHQTLPSAAAIVLAVALYFHATRLVSHDESAAGTPQMITDRAGAENDNVLVDVPSADLGTTSGHGSFAAFQRAFHEEFGTKWSAFAERVRGAELDDSPRQFLACVDELERADGVQALLALRNVEPTVQQLSAEGTEVRRWLANAIGAVDAIRDVRAQLVAVSAATNDRVRGLRVIVDAVQAHAGRVANPAGTGFYDRMLCELRGQMAGFGGFEVPDVQRLESAIELARNSLRSTVEQGMDAAKQPGVIEAVLMAEFGVPPPIATAIGTFAREVLVPFVEDEVLPKVEQWLDGALQDVVEFIEELVASIADWLERLFRDGHGVDDGTGRGKGGGGAAGVVAGGGAGARGGPGTSRPTGSATRRCVEGLDFGSSVDPGALLGNIGAADLGGHRLLPLRVEGGLAFTVESSDGERHEFRVDAIEAASLYAQLTEPGRLVNVVRIERAGELARLTLEGLDAVCGAVTLDFEAGVLALVEGLLVP
jgi:hypothetical protein